jgi:hypothetical protein
VENISNRSSWLDDFFEKGSPLYFALTTGETYDDNIFISPDKVGDFVTHISPAVNFQKGDMTAPHMNYLNLYFAPTLYLYANRSDQNRNDYDADLYYQYQWTRLTLGIEQHYQHLTDASIDIGSLATRDIYTTVGNGNYVYNDKLTFFASGTQQITSYTAGSSVDSNEWIADTYALYQVAPKLSLGGGARADFIDLRGAPNESHEDLLLHATYDPGGKLSMTLSAGGEYLQYQDNTSPSHLLPIFELTGQYSPSDKTTLSFSGSRQTVISYDLLGEAYVSTAISATIRHQMLEDVYLTLSGGYNISDYQFGSRQETGPRRNDNYYSVNFGLEWDPEPWLKVEASYQRLEDDSSLAQNSFNDNRIDVQTVVAF